MTKRIGPRWVRNSKSSLGKNSGRVRMGASILLHTSVARCCASHAEGRVELLEPGLPVAAAGVMVGGVDGVGFIYLAPFNAGRALANRQLSAKAHGGMYRRGVVENGCQGGHMTLLSVRPLCERGKCKMQMLDNDVQ